MRFRLVQVLSPHSGPPDSGAAAADDVARRVLLVTAAGVLEGHGDFHVESNGVPRKTIHLYTWKMRDRPTEHEKASSSILKSYECLAQAFWN